MAKKSKKKAQPDGNMPNQAAQPAKAVKAAPAKQKKAAPKAAGRSNGGIAGAWETINQFFREVKTELKKVTWPSRKQTVSSTGVVLVLVILVSIFLGGVDLILSWLVKQVLGLGA